MKNEKNKKIEQTDIVVVLDRSGSMSSIQEATVEGFNKFLVEQQNSEGEAFLTLIQFDDRVETPYTAVPVKEVSPLISGVSFVPRGGTALLDTIGSAIEKMHETKRDVVFVIITDGEENASKTYTKEAIFKMIETQQNEEKWKFLFLAANQDAIRAGGSLGISSTNSINYTSTKAGTTNAFYSASENITKYRSAKMAMFSTDFEENSVIASAASSLDFSDEQRSKTLSSDENS
jgi:Mg-chelatase subunit ChlD